MNPKDPLAQLRDIHLPETGGIWPPAPGWWLLAILLLAGITFTLVLWQKRRKHNAWRRQARRLLKQLELSSEQDARWFAELNALLKRVARQAYPARSPETLSGQRWVDFLLETGPEANTSHRQVAEALVASCWQPAPGTSTAEALAFARSWLEANT